MVGTAPVRGVCPEYGDMRNEVPSEGRWINSSMNSSGAGLFFSERA